MLIIDTRSPIMSQTIEMKSAESTIRTVDNSTNDIEKQISVQNKGGNLRSSSFILIFRKKSRTKRFLIKITSVFLILFIIAIIIFYYKAVIKRKSKS